MDFKIKCEDESLRELVNQCIDIRKKMSDSMLKISEIASQHLDTDELDDDKIDEESEDIYEEEKHLK